MNWTGNANNFHSSSLASLALFYIK